MEIQDRSILILGGSGLVGLAVARCLLAHRPASLVLTGLRRDDAEAVVAEIRAEGRVPEGVEIAAEWGDIFLPHPVKDRRRSEAVSDPDVRGILLDDLLGELTDEVVERSTLGELLLRRRPDVIVDCVNTATALAYQDVFESAARLRGEAERGSVGPEQVERHLATLYMPQLIRHVQIALEAMRRAGTRFYMKIGTSGTGGMGLNIPFTHSEERPSRTLLSKAGLAGAHTLLLYLMARTPGAPAVKEIKPTTAISWKRIGYGEIQRGGRPIERWDATRPVPLDAALSEDGERAATPAGGTLHGVFVDAGENGLFSASEFEIITALGLMEYITPEEIADNVVREILGHPTGRDVVAALDAATSGPTYRAGVLRGVALERMAELEGEHGDPVAYEMLGPPRVSKLLFEAAILGRLYPDLAAASTLNADETATRAAALIQDTADLRTRILSIGLPILLPTGDQILRGPAITVRPRTGQSPDDPRVVDNGWVDLRPLNWRRWQERTAAMLAELAACLGPDHGSRVDIGPSDQTGKLRPGRMVAWILRTEDKGERIKR